jgi:ATP phosphoribosyltransferase
MQLKLAVPKGRLMPLTGALLQSAGLEFSGYDEGSRSYRPECRNMPDLFLKVFHEKDIPIQVAVGNYDLGICGGDWVEELLAKYPSSSVVKVRDLGYGRSDMYLVGSKSNGLSTLGDLKDRTETVSIASEYPNLAEHFALGLRLRRFKVFPLWGGAEVYPPENADLALICRAPESPVEPWLVPLSRVLISGACVIAHRSSWKSKDLSSFLKCLCTVSEAAEAGEDVSGSGDGAAAAASIPEPGDSAVRLALPDGHQQEPTLACLRKAGIQVLDNGVDPRRPGTDLTGVSIKMVRPQDMPLQVANGNFDLAITGEDWLYDHLCRFPSSPVRKILSLGFGKVRIVAVVTRELPADSPQELRDLLRRGDLGAMRIASEYTNIADKYARDNHLSPYRLIPTWGASEAFLPEDADVLVENTQTGRTLAEHGLKIIDTILESSGCLIGSADTPGAGSRLEVMDSIIEALKRGIAEN